MGEWIDDWVVADEGGASVAERTVGATSKRGCGCDPASLVRLGAELFKAGIEFGRK